MRWCQRSAVTAAVAVCASLVLGASAASLPETRSGATTVREGVEPAGADLSAAAAGDGAYDWIDSRQAGGPSFDWIDIPATASSVSFGDDFVDNEVVYVGWPFEFSFPFFGVLQTRVGLTTNGLMLFGSDETSAPARHMPIPTSTAPNGFIAGFWGDLATGPNPRFNCRTSTGAVRYGMEPGGERFVVEFHLGQFCWASSRILLDRGSLTFQVVLDSDGTILIQYADVQGSPRGTIGVEDRYGATGAAVVFDTSTWLMAWPSGSTRGRWEAAT